MMAGVCFSRQRILGTYRIQGARAHRVMTTLPAATAALDELPARRRGRALGCSMRRRRRGRGGPETLGNSGFKGGVPPERFFSAQRTQPIRRKK